MFPGSMQATILFSFIWSYLIKVTVVMKREFRCLNYPGNVYYFSLCFFYIELAQRSSCTYSNLALWWSSLPCSRKMYRDVFFLCALFYYSFSYEPRKANQCMVCALVCSPNFCQFPFSGESINELKTLGHLKIKLSTPLKYMISLFASSSVC